MKTSISILIVDDEESVRDSLYNWFIEDGYEVDSAANAKEALTKIESGNFDIILADIKMPGMDGLEMHRRIKEFNSTAIVIVMTAFASVETAVQALKDGAFDYITKPFDPDDLSHLIRNAARQISLRSENETLKNKIVTLENIEDIVGNSENMIRVLKEVENVAASSSSVIITGESGTGKELIAHAIHSNSPRKFFPMVTVHCGALSEDLLESELFGHEKGAFTGAMFNRKGRFEMADGGTIFLDEIATISMKMQVELLRVLESKTFTRVGGNKEIKSDFRIICATNKDLKKMVADGSFREDLYYRLNVVNIAIPPLRDRKEDIPVLVSYFIKKYCTSMSRDLITIDQAALQRLEEYNYPGNVRELENMIERAIVVGNGKEVRLKDLPLEPDSVIDSNDSLDELEKKYIQKTLEKYDWNISRSAKVLQIDRVTLYNKIRKYQLSSPKN
ncbi:two component, sigma54 specific, transcriptional regulator, Fis family [Draconibacterium orientale]|jgi:DNA-binding NtrC family response regulator|uniref:Fis family transcriptional regulator n=1 Tax=Draconibacterium orientale TaxID=1168034 RepID=X5D7N1_9BACT|nr:sigma-54 dependent transcriptional regulator [Draconibacterium orientale]AHW58703.1 Fis family transcriptional regulator [Draconibacterium orientale]SET10497.1 two component, sigma54 specific, transcriptional regulator, Fis family [Draconibacterium orientale]